MIVSSNKPCGRCGETFGDETIAVAMIDRLVHHAEVYSFRGESYRIRGRSELGRTPTSKIHTRCEGQNSTDQKGSRFTAADST